MSVHALLSSLPSVRSLDTLTPAERRATMTDVTSRLVAPIEQYRSVATAAGRDLLASEQRDADALMARVAAYEARDRELRLAEDEAAAAAVATASPTGGSAHPIAYRAGAPLATGQSFAGYARARGLADPAERSEPLDFGRFLRGMSLGDWKDAEAERRAMSAGTNTGGGYLVPTLLSAGIIDLARAATAVGQLGAQSVPMESGKVDVGKWTGDPTAAWHTEGAAISASDPTVGKMTLQAQALAALVVCSREVLEDVPGLTTQLTMAFAAAFALKLDYAALRGTGTAPEPRGVKNTSGIQTTVLGTGDGQYLYYNDVIDAAGKLTDANEACTGLIWHPRSGRSLDKRVDDNGQYIVPPPSVASIPRAATTQIPINLTVGASTDCSEIYAGDWSKLVLGIRTQLLVQPLVERYADNGQVGFLAWMRADVGVARPAAFHLVTGVRAAA